MDEQEPSNTVFTPPLYHTYVLRCWQERSAQPMETTSVWRFSLEDPSTGRRRGFASLEVMFDSLFSELMGNEE